MNALTIKVLAVTTILVTCGVIMAFQGFGTGIASGQDGQTNNTVTPDETTAPVEPTDVPSEPVTPVQPAAPTADIWDGTVSAVTEDEGIYRIYTASQLAWVAQATNDGTMGGFDGKTIILMNDIDLASIAWTPIGNAANPFTGTFNGNGHTISNVSCEGSEDYVGLFGHTENGAISSLTVDNIQISGSDYVGGLAGYLGSTATDVSVISTSGFDNTITGNLYVGGIAGYLGGTLTGASVSNTAVECLRINQNPTHSIADKGENAGGIAGFSNAAIVNCSVADSSIIAFNNAGGIVGNIQQSGNASIDGVTVTNVTITIDRSGITDPSVSGDINSGDVYGRAGADVVVQNTSSTGTQNDSINCYVPEAPVMDRGEITETPAGRIDDGSYTLDSVDITSTTGSVIEIDADTDVTLIIKGECTLTSTVSDAITVPATSSVTIKGYDKDSKLTVIGENGSGIGGAGEINIIDLTISAIGNGTDNYGIGGPSATVTITGSHVIEAMGGMIPLNADSSYNFGYMATKYGKSDPNGGCGIGGLSVTIDDTVIDLVAGGSKAAAIGAQYHCATSVTIIDSTIKAAYGGCTSAGIGGAREPSGDTTWQTTSIYIRNSDVTAYGGTYGAGIGSGYDTYTKSVQGNCNIVITSYSKITAVGGQYASGVGTGYHHGNLSGYIDSTVDVSNVSSGEAFYKASYSTAQDIGYGVVNGSKEGSCITDNGIQFSVAGVDIENPLP